ncbi:PorV/PorQ family protein [bacterium]|nr:PorV/PorQ family protein [bacterium]
MKTKLILLSLFSVPCIWASGFQSLGMGPEARWGAMGNSGVAIPEGAFAGCLNPAGLARPGGGFALTHVRWFQDVSGSMLGFWSGDSGSGTGACAAFTEIPDIAYRNEVPVSEPLGFFNVYEAYAALSRAKAFGNLSAGLSVKLLYSKTVLEDAWGAALDAGFLCRTPVSGLTCGAVVQNLGKTGSLRSEDIPLPFTVKAGAAWSFRALRLDWKACVDGIREKEVVRAHAGLEAASGRVWLRCGYQAGYENRGLTAGLGLKTSRFRLDYGYMPVGSSLGDVHLFTFGLQVR